jgi:hypothetical protein
MNLRKGAMTIALSALIPSLASAQLAQTGRLEGSGGGLGSQLTLLTLQSPGNTSNESGCITPTATSCAGFADVGVQNGQSQVQLKSNPELAGLTGDNIRIIVNLTEPNTTPETAMGTLNDLRLILYGSGGNVLFTSAGLVGPVDLSAPGAGIGNFGFTFGLTGGDIAAFNAAYANATSIGVAASLSNVTGGPETINVARANNVTSVVPEPSTYALMAAGLGGLLMVRRRRRTQ